MDVQISSFLHISDTFPGHWGFNYPNAYGNPFSYAHVLILKVLLISGNAATHCRQTLLSVCCFIPGPFSPGRYPEQ